MKKLRRDLLENPEKYEEMLKRKADEEHEDSWLMEMDPGRYGEHRTALWDDREYWHRLRMDGYCVKRRPDNWPKRVEYYKFKEWADSIEERALDTLKYTVSRLLLDFEDDASLENKVTEFTPETKESKQNSLKRLLVMLNEESTEPLEAKTKTK